MSLALISKRPRCEARPFSFVRGLFRPVVLIVGPGPIQGLGRAFRRIKKAEKVFAALCRKAFDAVNQIFVEAIHGDNSKPLFRHNLRLTVNIATCLKGYVLAVRN